MLNNKFFPSVSLDPDASHSPSDSQASSLPIKSDFKEFCCQLFSDREAYCLARSNVPKFSEDKISMWLFTFEDYLLKFCISGPEALLEDVFLLCSQVHM